MPNNILHAITTALRCSLVLCLLCGGLYNFLTTQLAGYLFPYQAAGSLIKQQDHITGSALIGQNFTQANYLHGRPSAINYDPRNAAGSNWGPAHPNLRARVMQASAVIQNSHTVQANQIPVDLLTASGSGLDPDISLESAQLQLPRIAIVRQIPPDQLNQLLMQQQQLPQWGIFGQPRINVLQFNLALDSLFAYD